MSEYKSLQNIAYDYLREMIYSRKLEFDVIYSETRLANTLSISRTPIRDALNRLNRERYIDILPNRGFQLRKPDEKDIREAYHVRMMIEGYCIEVLAKEHQTPKAQASIDRMQKCLDNQIALLESKQGVDLHRFWIEDHEFHITMLKHLDISAFNLQYDSFLHVFMPQYLKSDYVLARNHSTIPEHRKIIESLRAGDVGKARDAVEAHLNSTLKVSLLNAANEEGKKAIS